MKLRLLMLALLVAPVFGCVAASDSGGAGGVEGAAAPAVPLAVELDETGKYRPRSFNVGFLILPKVYNTELTAPYDMFNHVQYHATPKRNPELFAAEGEMECFTVAQKMEPIATFEGLKLLPHYNLRNCPPIDVLVVPSAEGNMGPDLENTEVLDWVRETAEGAQYVMSLCDGAFILAGAGLLNGVDCTTFPSDRGALVERFPEVRMREVSFVDAGKYLTSVGGEPSFEVALYLIEKLYGTAVAKGVAGGLVIDWDVAKLDYYRASDVE